MALELKNNNSTGDAEFYKINLVPGTVTIFKPIISNLEYFNG